MICDFIKIGQNDAELRTFATQNYSELCLPPRRAMLILPGGGYGFCSDREGEPIAKAFNALGFNSFVLYYSLNEKAKFPTPLREASEAMVYIKRNAERYHIDPEQVYVCGFSAGGHLAASLGTLWNTEDAAIPDMKPGENKPRGMVLAYPVITVTGEYRNSYTADNIMGRHVEDGESGDDCDRYSPDKRVTKDTVPAFIWNTRDDDAVLTQNSEMMVRALTDAGIPYEYHCFGHGPHGLALANYETHVLNKGYIIPEIARWPQMVLNWIETGERFGDFK